MRQFLQRPGRIAVPVLTALVCVACSDNAITTVGTRSPAEAPPQLAVASVAVATPRGRALAANCFQCHGTDGHAGELKIAGESASEIISELNEMRAEPAGRNIMNVHALGYTPDQISQIADYFSRVGR